MAFAESIKKIVVILPKTPPLVQLDKGHKISFARSDSDCQKIEEKNKSRHHSVHQVNLSFQEKSRSFNKYKIFPKLQEVSRAKCNSIDFTDCIPNLYQKNSVYFKKRVLVRRPKHMNFSVLNNDSNNFRQASSPNLYSVPLHFAKAVKISNKEYIENMSKKHKKHLS